MQKLLYLILFLIIGYNNVNGQFIVAGSHEAHDYYYDFSPDKSIHALAAPGYNIDTLLIDINDDAINDIKLTALYDDFGQWHHIEYCVVTPLNNNFIAISGFDSCFANCPPDSLLYKMAMADSLSLNDTIDGNDFWTDSLAYLTFDGWRADYPNNCGYGCNHQTFSTDSKFIGVRVSLPTGSLFGWLKVKVADNHTIIVEEYACNLIPTNVNSYPNKNLISIFPNPFFTHTLLQSDKVLKDAKLTVYNSIGQQVKQIDNITGQSVTLYRDNLPGGMYFIHLTENDKTIATGKIVITYN